MALSKSEIDLIYQELLARHATLAEQDAFSALSNNVSALQLQQHIITLPEATNIVDPIFRLYQGAFGRLPDAVDPNGNFDSGAQSGFWVNVNAVRDGVSIQGLANAFVASSEFHDLYGSTTVTPALITAFYHNILGRDPSSAEVGAWVDTGLDAGGILHGFTQSTEFTARSQASVNQSKLDLCPLPPPPPEFSLDGDVDLLSGVDEGNALALTLQGPESAAGQTFSYIIRGIDPEDIVGGQLVGLGDAGSEWDRALHP